MAASPSPLVWGMMRKVDNAENVGGLVHYFDSEEQSIYLQNGDIATNIGQVVDGNWGGITGESYSVIFENTFNALAVDHPKNGVVYLAAVKDGFVWFAQYMYFIDLGEILTDFEFIDQMDNRIDQFDAHVMNIDGELFSSDVSIFNPGAKVDFAVRMGDSEEFKIATMWIDEVEYEVGAEEISISGRNTIGFFLKDQTFDEYYQYGDPNETGTLDETTSHKIHKIFEHAGLNESQYIIQSYDDPTPTGQGTQDWTFERSQSMLDGLEEIFSWYSKPDTLAPSGRPLVYDMFERPNGIIVVGYLDYREQYRKNSFYTFELGREIFTRSTRKTIDASYTRLVATGYREVLDTEPDVTEPDGSTHRPTGELTPVILDINTYRAWNLGPHKTAHMEAPGKISQDELAKWAARQAEKLQYVGITEDFTGPLRPQLLSGDVAEINQNGTGITLGIITEVRHVFNLNDGFRTEFSVDSGGVFDDGTNFTVLSPEVGGYNRKQNTIDMIQAVYNSRVANPVGYKVNSGTGAGTGTVTPQYSLPIAQSDRLGGVKPVAKTSLMTKDIGIDSTGKLYAASDLPAVSGTDAGKGLVVDSNGQWVAAPIEALPAVTSSDNHSILAVVNGVWTKIDIKDLLAGYVFVFDSSTNELTIATE